VLIILNLNKTRRHGYNLHLQSKEFPLTVQHFRQNEKIEQTDRKRTVVSKGQEISGDFFSNIQKKTRKILQISA
jgi:hypothetical protein